MINTKAYAALSKNTPLVPYEFERREPNAHDIVIDILYSGICHSDVHQARSEWGEARYPLVPGHEIVGCVTRIGHDVKKFKVGDIAGVGCMVDACRQCEECHDHLEQFCPTASYTYNDVEQDGKTPTMGGYANNIVVNEDFAFQISPTLDLARVAPLLCAGITTYSPLKYWNVKKGDRVGVIGLGGLGHMAVKLAKSFGAYVVVFTTSAHKKQDALDLGADEVILSVDKEVMQVPQKLNLIISTLSVSYDMSPYLAHLKRDGVMSIVGLPPEAVKLNLGSIIAPRRKISGSLIGGIIETQEMLDHCAKHNIVSDIELIKMQDVNQAYDRLLKSDVKYRFVIDIKNSSF
jgi:uncharacterized zinc-type alcohol dehydrogenase-like protein